MIEKLKKLNPHIDLQRIDPTNFKPYGRILDQYDFSELIQYMDTSTSVPDDGNIYRPSVPEMEQTRVYESIRDNFYGQMPVQFGYCNGPNSSLNGLEYHLGSEINVAATDLVLLLGKLDQIIDNRFDVQNVKGFFIPRGTSIQIFETTLHFAPCKVHDSGFKCVVILPRGTNEPLDPQIPGRSPLLFAKNKWLLAHPLRHQLILKGAFPGITGQNITVRYK